jgi:hypothetical protein
MVDLKKEIKLSDLFRRTPKEASDEAAVAAPPAEPKPEKKSLMKRELSFGRKKGDGEPKPKREKKTREPKAPKEPRGRRKAAPVEVLPAVPLMRAFDLMPRDERDGEGRRLNTAQLVLAVVGLVMLAALASVFLITNAKVADKEQDVNESRSRLAALEQPQEKPVPVGSDQTLIQERDNRTSALGIALGRRVAWDRLMRDISLVLPSDVWLDGMTATSATPTDATQAGVPPPPPDPTAIPSLSTFQLTGFARRQASIAALLSRMAVLPEISSAQLVSATSTEVGGETVVQFTVSGVLKASGIGGTT